MSFQQAMSTARALSMLTEDAVAIGSLDADAVEHVLARREALIWELSAACRPETLAAATALERQELVALLRSADATTQDLLDAAKRARDEAHDRLMEVLPTQRAQEVAEPRFTERVA